MLLRYIAGRLLLACFVIMGVLTLTFAISHVIPADPARAAAGLHASPEAVEAMRQEMGLDLPVVQRYFLYLGGLLRADLGRSIHTRRPVLRDLRDYFPATAELVFLSFGVSCLLGLCLGITAAVKRNTVADHLCRVLSVGGVAVPMFWLALMMQLLFYRKLGWLPYGGRISDAVGAPVRVTGMMLIDTLLAGNGAGFLSVLRHAALPTITLASYPVAMITRLTRSSMLEVMTAQYIYTARAKGLREWTVINKHALKNALIPVLTVIGLQFGFVLGGNVVVELIFNWAGMGLYVVNSVLTMDFPAIMGCTLVIAVVFCLVNLLVDLLYAYVDPRVKYG
ncbi:MAG: ABC transporter permease [Bacillota bacterium]